MITKLFILMVCNLTIGWAQLKVTSITVSDEVVFVTVDRPGDLYITLKDGQIKKFNSAGKLIGSFKTDPSPALFEPRDGSRLFAYYRNDQHYVFLNPSFETTSSYRLDSSYAISPWLACSSGDHNIWILDEGDKTIKKILTATSAIDVEIRLESINIKEIIYMREYQGFLFLLHRTKGILVFNNIGKSLKTLGTKGLDYFNFFGEELYYMLDGSIHFFNLFTAETRSINIPKPARFAILTHERLYLITGRTVELFTTPQ